MAALGDEVVEVMSVRCLLMEPLRDRIVLCQPLFRTGVRSDDQKAARLEEGKSSFEGIH